MTTVSRSRKYDVVIYGASGFVGRQAAAYLAQRNPATGPGGRKRLSWALAGRSASKLEAIRLTMGDGARQAGIVVAEAHDAHALDALASNATVVLNTAGPFALYGSELVAACVRHGTHYVDITGETPWVREMIQRHHATAVKAGVRIIPFCGFDSVPSDLGAWLVAQTMQTTYGEPCDSIKACFTVRGGVNGGTLASLFNIMGSGQSGELADPYLLNPAPGKRKAAQASRTNPLDRDPIAPLHDADFNAWLGPFFMGPINTRVVRRSATLLTPARGKPAGYARDFHYQEYMRFGSSALAGAAAAVFSAGMVASQVAMSLGPLRRLAGRMVPGPGSGPSDASMDGGSFRCELIGKSASGHIVRGVVADKGDPGNRATTKMVCESALCLALQIDALPGGPALGGVLTPASGLGEVLLGRLRVAGMTLDAQ